MRQRHAPAGGCCTVGVAKAAGRDASWLEVHSGGVIVEDQMKGRFDPAVAAIMALGRAEAAEGRRRAREVETA